VSDTLTSAVLDTAAVVSWTRRQPYIGAVYWALMDHGATVVVPAAVLAAAAADTKPAAADVLGVLLNHPNTLVPALDHAAAATLGAVLAARRDRDQAPDALISAAHAVAEATARGVTVYTDRPEALAAIDPDVLFDTLP